MTDFDQIEAERLYCKPYKYEQEQKDRMYLHRRPYTKYEKVEVPKPMLEELFECAVHEHEWTSDVDQKKFLEILIVETQKLLKD